MQKEESNAIKTRKNERDNTISKKRIVQLQQWVCYNDVSLVSLLQWFDFK